MKSTGPDDLRAIGDPLAAEMIPGWRVEWRWVDSSEIGGALAMVSPDAKREMATIKVAPHPAGEDVGETIAHELTHATLRPLVELIPESPASIGIEERIAERIGVLIARLWRSAPARARAVIRALRADLPTITGARARARIAALAHRRARGDSMDPIDLILAAVEAAAGADDPKEALTALLGKVRAIKDGSSGAEPDGDDPPGDPMAKDPLAPAKPGDAPPPPAGGDMRARVAAFDADAARARAARIELERILADSRTGAVANLITSLRARLPSGHKGLVAVEKRILAAGDYGAAKMIHDLAIEMAPEEDAATLAARARGGDRLTASPSLGKPAIVKPADLDKFDPAFQTMWQAVAENEGQEAADLMLSPARARLARDAAQGRA